jgi:hypothetical protein
MRIAIATVALALALPAAASAAAGPKVVNFTATTTVKSSSASTFVGTFSSRRLGNGTFKYTSRPSGDAAVTRWKARLKAGTLKGSARTTLTPGATATDPPTIDGAGKITGGTGRYDGAKGNLVISGGGNPDGTLTLRIDGVLQLALR